MRPPRIQITGVSVLILLAIGGLGYGIYDRYTPRRDSFTDAVVDGDLADMRRWLRRDPTLATQPSDSHGADIAFVAIESNQPDALRLIVERGGGYEEMLHSAVGSAMRDCVHVLLELGADANESRSSLGTPLQLLADGGVGGSIADDRNATEIATLLLDAGADVDGRSPGGYTPLQRTVVRHALRLGDLLVKRGAHIGTRADMTYMLGEIDNECDAIFGGTLLHYAVVYRDDTPERDPTERFDWLIERGASLTATARYRPFESPGGATVEVDCVRLAWLVNNDAALARLLDLRLTVPDDLAVDRSTRSLLHRMIAAERIDHVERLLDAGFDPNVGDADHWSAVNAAYMIDDEGLRRAMLDLLNRHGARIEPSTAE